ncbi:hypothetical protein [Deinococcus fonticola]|uniref:hypothetical protein n=1 Tax=Deinococcus fonticola TaxID=2528713 RepID=UPI001074C34C|nr:hypothetical protein [Deinococcus fonticola]
MLRAAFRLTALLLIPVGLYLYFIPPDVARLLGVSPLWLARVLGGLLLAWGTFQVAAAQRPDGAKVGGLAGGNLLMVATLLPAVMRSGEAMPALLRAVLLGLCLLLGALALSAILSYASGGARGR